MLEKNIYPYTVTCLYPNNILSLLSPER